MDLGGNIDKLLPFYVLQIRKHRAVALHAPLPATLSPLFPPFHRVSHPFKKKAVSGSDNGHGGHGDFDDRSFRGSENRNRPAVVPGRLPIPGTRRARPTRDTCQHRPNVD
ncbi:hypothetical protein CPAR01_05936 [Colletotrichum paranaense]|uniref:Uncharacterized protein n=1 Tax=Colletotrichum paranaense TaxID=1914294 RepID=A0ABQ9SSQ1_9PEZI|nr:uncharacterized protein CPAR01_05936 [Colletotrichum paranaense]KAK1542549.1 hypothetical protein CPAR01_05936 [Colletotrichum paranaense]